MISKEEFHKALPNLSSELLESIWRESDYASFPPKTELLREGQYVKVIPLVVKGSVKVLADFNEKELLLYHIQPSQSCAMSFSAVLHNSPSQIKAITDEDSDLLLMPSGSVNDWMKLYPEFNKMFFDQYQLRYSEMLQTIEGLLFGRMDQRLLNYLKTIADSHQGAAFKKTHREIAQDLGTAREVVSRVIKKLENEAYLEQKNGYIKLL